MRFGIVAPTTPDLIVHCETAEALGFEAAWLFDSHMVYSDVYVIMALYANRTRRLTFGTGIGVAPPRRLRAASFPSSWCDRGLRWDDGVDARQAPPHHESVLRELERLRIAEGTRKAVNLSM